MFPTAQEKPFTAGRFAKLRNDALQKSRTAVVGEPLTPLWVRPQRSDSRVFESQRAVRTELPIYAKERLRGFPKGEGRTLKFSRLFPGRRATAAADRGGRSSCRQPHLSGRTALDRRTENKIQNEILL
jgi:hypothetical protein